MNVSGGDDGKRRWIEKEMIVMFAGETGRDGGREGASEQRRVSASEGSKPGRTILCKGAVQHYLASKL